MIKPIEFCGRSLLSVRKFPAQARRELGYQLHRVQCGLNPIDWKPLPAIGKGLREIRVSDNGQFRVIYLATFGSTVIVLHAFQKKTQTIRKQDIHIARTALKKLVMRKML